MYLKYPSSLDENLQLYADFQLPSQPSHLRLHFHGWHGSVNKQHQDNVAASEKKSQLMIHVEMRGRGDSTGKPDCNGWELQDAIDAVEFARSKFSEYIIEPDKVFLSGGSGGGGNVLAILGKFPDYFCRAHVDCGISDYVRFYNEDAVGEFRDEMEGAGWIGGNPTNNKNAYLSRGGLTSVQNLLTPVIIFHGQNDIRVPATHARDYIKAAQQLDKWPLITYVELPDCGGGDHWSNITLEQKNFHQSLASSYMELPSDPIQIPRKGKFIIPGFLKTKEFSVTLDTIDDIAELIYDLDKSYFEINKSAKILYNDKVINPLQY